MGSILSRAASAGLASPSSAWWKWSLSLLPRGRRRGKWLLPSRAVSLSIWGEFSWLRAWAIRMRAVKFLLAASGGYSAEPTKDRLYEYDLEGFARKRHCGIPRRLRGMTHFHCG